MSNGQEIEPKRRRLLEAAMTVFARYGFRRASMADIAAEAGVSRPALYLSFRSKEDVLRSLADMLCADALAGAEAAWTSGATFVSNIEATLLGKELGIFRLVHASPHGAEILAADARLTADASARLDTAFRALLARRITEARVDLTCVGGDAAALAAVLALGARAALNEAADEGALRESLRRLARVAAAATAAR